MCGVTQISGHFEFDVLPNGDIVQYPKGDRSAPPSGRMPKDGFYFDAIVRQEPIDESKLDPREWVEQTYSLYTRTEMYLRGGYNVYPAEVERVVSGHPSVSQVAIVAKADPVLGQVGVAFVVPTKGEDEPTLVQIREWTQKSIANYKAPDILELVTELPLTSVGKVDKRSLTERARDLTRAR